MTFCKTEDKIFYNNTLLSLVTGETYWDVPDLFREDLSKRHVEWCKD